MLNGMHSGVRRAAREKPYGDRIPAAAQSHYRNRRIPMTMPLRTTESIIMDVTGDDIFIVVNGVRIAKRGHPGTPQAKTWVSLEPGWAPSPRGHAGLVRVTTYNRIQQEIGTRRQDRCGRASIIAPSSKLCTEAAHAAR